MNNRMKYIRRLDRYKRRKAARGWAHIGSQMVGFAWGFFAGANSVLSVVLVMNRWG